MATTISVARLGVPRRALAARFEQADPGRDRDVERGYRAEQRDGDDPVAKLARQPAQPRPFGAQHPGERPRQVGVEQVFGAAGLGAGQPHAAILELAQRPGKIGDGDDRHRVRRARGRLGDRRIDADRAVLGHDHRVRAERVGAAQARAQVVRIGHAVEHQQQRRLVETFEHVVERAVRQRRVDFGDDALVPVAAGDRIEPLVVDRMHGHAGAFRTLDQLARTTVVARRDHVDRAHAFRMLAQSRGDGVEAGEITGVGHRGGVCGQE